MRISDKRRSSTVVLGAEVDAELREQIGDPEAAAFADAVRQIRDPKKRAFVQWLVLELARKRVVDA